MELGLGTEDDVIQVIEDSLAPNVGMAVFVALQLFWFEEHG